MKLKDITPGQTVAVMLYGSADSRNSLRYTNDKGETVTSYAADEAEVLEVGIHGMVYRGRSIYPHKSTTANYVKVLVNGREETVINTKILDDWTRYTADQDSIITARLKTQAETAAARKSTDARLAEIAELLGINTYELPTLSSGHRGYSASTLDMNKRALIKVLEAALAYNG